VGRAVYHENCPRQTNDYAKKDTSNPATEVQNNETLIADNPHREPGKLSRKKDLGTERRGFYWFFIEACVDDVMCSV